MSITIRSRLLLVVSISVALAGCGEGDGTNRLFTRLNDAQASASVVACECFEYFMATSEAECQAMLRDVDLTRGERDCLDAAFAMHAEELEPLSNCQITVYRNAETCISAVAGCDADAMDACISAADDAQDMCGEPSVAAQMDIDACIP